MERFALVVNRQKDPALAVAGEICKTLTAYGKKCTIADLPDGETVDVGDGIPEDTECMIVLGGDGTLLQAARNARKLDIPLLGVNLGTLGYLAEVEQSGIKEALRQLADGRYTIEERMMLSGRVNGREECALNDIVITRNGPLQVVRLTVRVDGQLLTEYQSDGIILATPTGSTGYSLSAGGPIVEPEARTILITPVSPHTLTNRSIVLSPHAHVQVEIGEGKNGRKLTLEASFDGGSRIPMETGEVIDIACAEAVTKILRLKQVSFLEMVRHKLG
ncbi:MAG: NAD(+)/NADH kinase [Lachnospiraceae bacterium]|nr:NAD(+)/NADH kinase [Lachnospiraceae bacterium]